MPRYKMTIVRNQWYAVEVEADSEEVAEKIVGAMDPDDRGLVIDEDDCVEEVECLDEKAEDD